MPPASILQRSSKHEIELARGSGNSSQQIAAEGANTDVLVVGCSSGQCAIVSLGDTRTPIMITGGECAPEDMLAQIGFAECEVLQIDIQFRIAIML